MIVVNPSTRQFNIPGADLVFGVTADASAVIKEFQCPRYVGNNLDLTGCFIRMNYRNANGEVDSYLVSDVTVDGDNIVFGWELSPRVTMYKGNVSFVMCVVGPDTKVAWHTTLGRGQVLEGLEPEWESVIDETVDVVAQLIAMVEAQTKAVADKGAEWVRNVQSEGTDQIVAVQTAGKESREAAVAEIEAKGVNVRESIPEDYTSLENTVDDLVRGRAGAIICEAAGSAVVVNDASNLPIQGMKIFGRSTQDGTPTPEVPVEIKSVVEPVVTVCEKNLFPLFKKGASVTANGVTYSIDDNGVITLNGTASAITWIEVMYAFRSGTNPQTKRIVAFDEAESYVFSRIVKGGSFTGSVSNTIQTDSAEIVLKDVHQKVFRSGGVCRGWITVSKDTVCDNYAFGLQIELGSEATEYKPYSGQTLELAHTLPGIPVESGGNYTDGNGQQWICDYVDFEKGVYVQRTASVVVNGSKNPSTFATGNKGGSVFAYQYDALEMNISRTRACKLCDRLLEPTTYDPASFKDCEIGHWGFNTKGSSDMFIVMNLGEFDSADTLVSWLKENPVTFVYVLATPIETALSETEIAAYRALHSNYPNTAVLNDSSAHMVVKYAADTKLYIDNKIAALVGG